MQGPRNNTPSIKSQVLVVRNNQAVDLPSNTAVKIDKQFSCSTLEAITNQQSNKVRDSRQSSKNGEANLKSVPTNIDVEGTNSSKVSDLVTLNPNCSDMGKIVRKGDGLKDLEDVVSRNGVH